MYTLSEELQSKMTLEYEEWEEEEWEEEEVRGAAHERGRVALGCAMGRGGCMAGGWLGAPSASPLARAG